jgi:hypothetical protein
LAQLEAREAVDDVERALEHFAEATQSPGLIEALAHFGELSSVPVLLDGLKRSRSVHIHGEIVEALGAFWSGPRAQRVVLEQLERWGGGSFDAGEQCPPLRALARADPALLIRRACELYDAGRLDRSAREELARLVPRLAQEDSVDGAALVGLLKRLACDQHLPVRERTGQALGRLNPGPCAQLYEELWKSLDEWTRACAIYTLGFWDSDERKIHAGRFANEYLIRYAADAAMETRARCQAQQRLVEQYCADGGMTRLSAYLALSEQGDEQALWSLDALVPEQSIGRTFLRQLASDITGRLRDERRKRADKEQKLLDTPGMVHFD